MPMAVDVERNADAAGGRLTAKVQAGRALWPHQMHHAITRTSAALAQHRWVVLRPHPPYRWFTSDHPVVRLNFQGPNAYNFRGGWGSTGTDLLLPPSPDAMLHAQVGNQRLQNWTASREQTGIMQRIVAERAFRWVIAGEETQRVSWFRPRRVDVQAFREEEQAFAEWHARNTELERQLASRSAVNTLSS